MQMLTSCVFEQSKFVHVMISVVFFFLLLEGINVKIELDVHASDQTYLNHLRTRLPRALDSFKPDIVVYNAGKYLLLFIVTRVIHGCLLIFCDSVLIEFIAIACVVFLFSNEISWQQTIVMHT